MAVLKVKTTGAPGETPVAKLAGTTETVGCATACCRPANNASMARK